jgi:hypothetical protein
MKIKWQHNGGRCHYARLGGDLYLYVFRSFQPEGRIGWRWSIGDDQNEYLAFRLERTFAEAKAAAALWWGTHGRIVASDRRYSERYAYLAHTGAEG